MIQGYEDFFPTYFKDDLERDEEIANLVEKTFSYIVKRRHWFKSFELLQDLVCKAFEANEIDNHMKHHVTLSKKLDVDIHDQAFKDKRKKEEDQAL